LRSRGSAAGQIKTTLPPNGPFRSVELTTEAFDKK
jgi:hypothetical protein